MLCSEPTIIMHYRKQKQQKISYSFYFLLRMNFEIERDLLKIYFNLFVLVANGISDYEADPCD